MSIEAIPVVSVPVSGEAAAKRFYVDVLGFEVVRDNPFSPTRPGSSRRRRRVRPRSRCRASALRSRGSVTSGGTGCMPSAPTTPRRALSKCAGQWRRRPSLDTIRPPALDVQALIAEENTDWSSVVEFQDIEIVV